MAAAPVAEAAAPGSAPRTSAAGGIPTSGWILALVLLLMPAFASDFFLVQVFGWAFVLGTIALSLQFLAGYGGMVSLVQMTVAGFAGYMVAILGTSGLAQISLGWPFWLAVPTAIALAVLFGTLSGALAVRTAGIYTIMITLAIAAAFFYFTRQNETVFGGFLGFNGVRAPVFWGIDWRAPVPFYYLCLAWAAIAWGLVVWVVRAPFGLALQGIRDNPRRMAALGFDVTAHRIAAYAFAAFLAAPAGILLTWLNGQIAPGTVGIGPVIDVLVIAVIGGLGRPIGPFVGALLYVLLRIFAMDLLVALGLSGQRFQLVIGLGFLLTVLFSPDGILGLWERHIRPRLAGERGGGR
ncbi:MAG: branched-chain amino acid ABC transporter permease [Geminicoccaceae bacterium]|nr:branched-chain amino acid ABC transporter permease [Geminicoccaceae bacterium]MCX7629369.1 branched-chain amino acid ABC transporter permease [Geminicoccaceae bacterium]MDW8123549.1 branched-chain amino acid ABC transporter permease [Geminicoccaceae bacterium]MDW8339890.1 branched-chain amino acid ABC transporter permease [Geminicoccaceae bacterium]